MLVLVAIDPPLVVLGGGLGSGSNLHRGRLGGSSQVLSSRQPPPQAAPSNFYWTARVRWTNYCAE